MCTRYTLTDLQAFRALATLLGVGVDLDLSALAARYNAAPRDRMPVITQRAGRRLQLGSFGLTSTAGPKPALLANARAETVLERPTFRAAARERRCLIPADGFYEWEKQGEARLPHYFTLTGGRPFFFAGLWEPGATPDDPPDFCIVTTTANAVLAPVHDRMPVILGPNSGPAWLGDEPLPPEQVARLCRPLRADMMTSRRVDPRVNNTRYKQADCIAAL